MDDYDTQIGVLQSQAQACVDRVNALDREANEIREQIRRNNVAIQQLNIEVAAPGSSAVHKKDCEKRIANFIKHNEELDGALTRNSDALDLATGEQNAIAEEINPKIEELIHKRDEKRAAVEQKRVEAAAARAKEIREYADQKKKDREERETAKAKERKKAKKQNKKERSSSDSESDSSRGKAGKPRKIKPTKPENRRKTQKKVRASQRFSDDENSDPNQDVVGPTANSFNRYKQIKKDTDNLTGYGAHMNDEIVTMIRHLEATDVSPEVTPMSDALELALARVRAYENARTLAQWTASHPTEVTIKFSYVRSTGVQSALMNATRENIKKAQENLRDKGIHGEEDELVLASSEDMDRFSMALLRRFEIPVIPDLKDFIGVEYLDKPEGANLITVLEEMAEYAPIVTALALGATSISQATLLGKTWATHSKIVMIKKNGERVLVNLMQILVSLGTELLAKVRQIIFIVSAYLISYEEHDRYNDGLALFSRDHVEDRNVWCEAMIDDAVMALPGPRSVACGRAMRTFNYVLNNNNDRLHEALEKYARACVRVHAADEREEAESED